MVVNIKYLRRVVTVCVLGWASLAAVRADEAAPALPARTALDDYIGKKDGSYEWKLLSKTENEQVQGFVVELTSQTWRAESEVDRTVWKHWLRIARPRKTKADTALLMIGGGRNGREPPKNVDDRTAALALASNAVVAELGMIPNQPLTFKDDGRPRSEDDLVAYTWNKFMATGDPTWVARMPMVKGAVRAMDAIQEFLATEAGGSLKIEKFVVAGGSKRGWTTWLTGAVDPRVVAIAPIVIDVLNVLTSMEHHYAAYGFWAPAIGDYEHNGVTDKSYTPEYQRLLRLVDPYNYRHRLKMPKLIINSTGDQFFLPDSSQFYYDDLLGEKHLRYVPNTDHGLGGSDAIETLQTFFHSVVLGRERPEYKWSFEKDGSIRVVTKTKPREVRLWHATNPAARDFRIHRDRSGPKYTSELLKREGSVYVGRRAAPKKGWTAYFVELTFPTDGPNPLKVTSGVRVVPDTLPHADKLEEYRERLKKKDLDPQ